MGPIEKLQFIYDHEINFRIQSFWDFGYSGFEAAFGDEYKGWEVIAEGKDLNEVIDKLYKAARDRVNQPRGRPQSPDLR